MPAVTVVVPTFARPERLAACLAALAAQTMRDFAVIVVDDGSDPPVRGVVEAARGFADGQLRYLRQDNAGPAAARNRGAGAADGPWLAFTDDDCRPRPDWLAALAAAAEAAPGALLGGHTVNGEVGNLFSEASQDLIGFLEAEDRAYFASNNLACPADGFAGLGGFAESFPLAGGEDRDFGLRWGAAGRPVAHVADAVVDHHHALDPRGFWRQHANYGRGARHMRGRNAAVAEGAAHRFARLGWYARLVSWPVRTRQPKGLRRAGLLAAAQVATAWGFVTPPGPK